MLSRPTPVPSDLAKRRSLEGEINALLLKGAVRIIPCSGTQTGFMSTFLTPKKEAGVWRPILNLKPLNKFIRPKRFRMETHTTILSSIVTPAWAASLDLKDAYLHVPVRPEHHKFLHFLYNDTLYEFVVLPFGLSTAPRVFTRIVKTIGAALRRRGIMIFVYLDDWLVVGRSREEMEAALQYTWRLTSNLRFIINTEKSHLIPSQVPTFLGASLDLRRGLARPSEEHLLNLRQCVSLFLSAVVAPALAWLRLLGLMASMVDLVDFCRLRMRPIQLHLLSFCRPIRHQIHHLVPTTPWLVPHFRWWLADANISQGRAFRPPPPSVTVTTDASLLGWGATLHPRQIAGVWGSEHLSAHINVLEILAVSNALWHFQSDVRGRAVLVRCDNATVVAYINHQGGTRSGRLCALAWDVIHCFTQQGTALSAVHIPGVENVTADALSRGWIAPTEWSLLPQVARSLFHLIDQPHVDLFASHANHQLPFYCARGPDPNVWKIDALSVQWDYAFPPISLVSRVLTKIEQEDCRVLLTAPFLPRQPWFPRLVRLLVHRPVILPGQADLLYQPSSRMVHSALGGSSPDDGPPPGRYTTADYAISLNSGLPTSLWIELHALSVETGHIRWEPGGVRLVPTTGFLTKNQSSSFTPPDIFVPDIKSFSSEAKDKLWCPVRALKWYLNRTKSLRTDHQKLFVTTTPPFRLASQCTISRWIVTAICYVPGGWPATENAIRAHDVRGVAACWKCPNTFSELYLKDVLKADGRAGREVLKTAS
ncbi:uncharacterized protein LOC117294748 [Asterias rubens]|uniref:uncharacterized protein LOC117294748 n=1 Tax=Asterias rubens TaxID=7604 RepID=UPI0014551A18|nr:uncharacterized protein LOC117294748 [Asterias rubens]